MTVGDGRRSGFCAIEQYSQLGAGFKIAMRDLEIRGAGNLLGTEQSGHITAVGFSDLYCQLLKTAVARMKGEKPGRLVETKLQLDFLVWQESDVDEKAGKFGAFLPRGYHRKAAGVPRRLPAHRRRHQPADLRKNCATGMARLGMAPGRFRWNGYCSPTEIKIAASEARIRMVETQEDKLMLQQGQDYIMVSGKFPRLTVRDAISKLKEIISWVVSLKRPS